ncbi:DUF5691 domain-containing protein [Deinococcus sp.]|uniref:DUF5691 domain-containing protein n=1 Tax=Deinococcus sp. TaxID=47478 RepID=UPI0025BA8640|nr:DUF5691 domain-containing protein [Deinococcus sp.]
MTLKDLAATALRGTARAELPKPDSSPLGKALARVQEGTPEQLLLARVALAGLHARAGKALDTAQTSPPTALPPATNPLPVRMRPLFVALLQSPAALMTLGSVKEQGWTLSAAQVLNLKEFIRPELWPLLDERGKAILDAHPLHEAWEKAEAQAQWEARLEALWETRAADADAGAAQTLELWQESSVEKRRDLLAVIERQLLPADLPLLKHAEKDRSGEIARRVRELQGHLPGPLQDELLALLPQAVVKKGDQLKFKPFELPEALGTAKVGVYDDSDLHRLLGALPFSLLLKVLDVRGEQLLQAAEKKHWQLGRQLKVQRDRERPEREAKASPVLTAKDAAQWFQSIQQKGQHEQVTFDLLAQSLDPAAEIAAPEPLPFVLPPAPTMPKERRLQWEENIQTQHAQRQAEAEAAWRSLTDILQLRREWAAGLEAEK